MLLNYYPIYIPVSRPTLEVEMPRDSKIIHATMRTQDTLMLYTESNVRNVNEKRYFKLYKPGEQLDGTFVSSVEHASRIYFLYEL